MLPKNIRERLSSSPSYFNLARSSTLIKTHVNGQTHFFYHRYKKRLGLFSPQNRKTSFRHKTKKSPFATGLFAKFKKCGNSPQRLLETASFCHSVIWPNNKKRLFATGVFSPQASFGHRRLLATGVVSPQASFGHRRRFATGVVSPQASFRHWRRFATGLGQ